MKNRITNERHYLAPQPISGANKIVRVLYTLPAFGDTTDGCAAKIFMGTYASVQAFSSSGISFADTYSFVGKNGRFLYRCCFVVWRSHTLERASARVWCHPYSRFVLAARFLQSNQIAEQLIPKLTA